MLYIKSHIVLSVVMIVYIEIKWVLLHIKLATVITISNSVNSRSLIAKFTLIVSYLVFSIDNKYSLPRSRYYANLVYK